MLGWSTSTPSCLCYIHTCIKTHTHTYGDKVRSCKVPNNSTGCAYAMWPMKGMNQLEPGEERRGKGRRRRRGSVNGHVGRGTYMRKERGAVEEQGRET